MNECSVQLESHRRTCCRKKGQPLKSKPRNIVQVAAVIGADTLKEARVIYTAHELMASSEFGPLTSVIVPASNPAESILSDSCSNRIPNPKQLRLESVNVDATPVKIEVEYSSGSRVYQLTPSRKAMGIGLARKRFESLAKLAVKHEELQVFQKLQNVGVCVSHPWLHNIIMQEDEIEQLQDNLEKGQGHDEGEGNDKNGEDQIEHEPSVEHISEQDEDNEVASLDKDETEDEDEEQLEHEEDGEYEDRIESDGADEQDREEADEEVGVGEENEERYVEESNDEEKPVNDSSDVDYVPTVLRRRKKAQKHNVSKRFKVGGTRLKQPGTKKMTQTSHKESSGPVALWVLGTLNFNKPVPTTVTFYNPVWCCSKRQHFSMCMDLRFHYFFDQGS
eukprot:Em0004g1048a